MANEKRIVNAEAIARKLKYAHCTDCHVVRQIQCSACWVNDVLELLDGDCVDAVEVVRCKDCKSFKWNPFGDGNYVCTKLSKHTNEDFFCSYGERREG